RHGRQKKHRMYQRQKRRTDGAKRTKFHWRKVFFLSLRAIRRWRRRPRESSSRKLGCSFPFPSALGKILIVRRSVACRNLSPQLLLRELPNHSPIRLCQVEKPAHCATFLSQI